MELTLNEKRELFISQLTDINDKLEQAYQDSDPELIIYGDSSWLITFSNGTETIGKNIEELYNFLDNSLETEE